MSGFLIVLISIIIIISGQLIRYYLKRKIIIYLSHIVGLIVVGFYSSVLINSQTGGVSFPWWIVGIFYAVPIFISLLICIIQDLIKR